MNAVGRRTIVGAVVVALGVPTLAGCALLSPARVDPEKAVLSKMPLELPQQPTRAVTLLVLPPETTPIYDTTLMAYTTRAYHVGYFSRHEWAGRPAQMLQPLLVGALQRTHAFGAVLTPPHAGRYTYALRTEIIELMQDFTSEPATLRLSLRLQLSDDTANRVVAIKEISLREPMQQKTPYAGVVAANDAAAKALQEIAGFVLEMAR